MQIKNVVTRPYEKSIPPGLSFEVDIEHIKFQEVIVNISGWVESDDGKVIANIVEFLPDKVKSNELAAKGSSLDSKFTKTVYHTILVSPLRRDVLNYIEKRRLGNTKRDIYLTLNLNVKILESRATISHLHIIEEHIRSPSTEIVTSSGRKTLARKVVYAHDPSFSTAYSNLWPISGNGKPIFLSINEISLRKEGIRIHSPDWIYDYAPKLELGEYFIIEIPKGKMTIKKAWGYVEKAEDCYRQLDTKGAYAHCREVGQLLNKLVNKKFRKLPPIKKWKRAIEKFDKLTSTDLHEENIKDEVPKGEISVGRAETEHILIVTKALIKYAEELLQEKRKE